MIIYSFFFSLSLIHILRLDFHVVAIILFSFFLIIYFYYSAGTCANISNSKIIHDAEWISVKMRGNERDKSVAESLFFMTLIRNREVFRFSNCHRSCRLNAFLAVVVTRAVWLLLLLWGWHTEENSNSAFFPYAIYFMNVLYCMYRIMTPQQYCTLYSISYAYCSYDKIYSLCILYRFCFE